MLARATLVIRGDFKSKAGYAPETFLSLSNSLLDLRSSRGKSPRSRQYVIRTQQVTVPKVDADHRINRNVLHNALHKMAVGTCFSRVTRTRNRRRMYLKKIDYACQDTHAVSSQKYGSFMHLRKKQGAVLTCNAYSALLSSNLPSITSPLSRTQPSKTDTYSRRVAFQLRKLRRKRLFSKYTKITPPARASVFTFANNSGADRSPTVQSRVDKKIIHNAVSATHYLHKIQHKIRRAVRIKNFSRRRGRHHTKFLFTRYRGLRKINNFQKSLNIYNFPVRYTSVNTKAFVNRSSAMYMKIFSNSSGREISKLTELARVCAAYAQFRKKASFETYRPRL